MKFYEYDIEGYEKIYYMWMCSANSHFRIQKTPSS